MDLSSVFIITNDRPPINDKGNSMPCRKGSLIVGGGGLV